MQTRRALGRGLNALIPEMPVAKQEETEVPEGNRVTYLKTDRISSSKYQPREVFAQEKIDELAASIKAKGLLQPILVRPRGDGYELIAGERRLRAVRSLGMLEVPAIIRDATDREVLEISLIENLQRQDLNPLEEAKGFQRLIAEFNYTHEEVGRIIGKDRTVVTNSIRLLRLPSQIQKYIYAGRITGQQALNLLRLNSLEEQLAVCKEIETKKLTIRDLEDLTRGDKPIKRKRRYGSVAEREPHLVAIEEELQKKLGTRVRIMPAAGERGRIQIEYFSASDFERLIGALRSINGIIL